MLRDLFWKAVDHGILRMTSMFGMEQVPSNQMICHLCRALVTEVQSVWVGPNVMRACSTCSAGRKVAERNDNGEWLVEYSFPGETVSTSGPWTPGAQDGCLAVMADSWLDQLRRVWRATAEISRWQIRNQPTDDDEGGIPMGPWESDDHCWMRPLAEGPALVAPHIPMEVLCNHCGKSCRPPVDASERNPFYGLINVVARGHYHSPVLPDLCTYRFSLCEPCLADLFDRFKIPPAGTCTIDNTAVSEWRIKSSSP